jgi:hypothetical protein
MNRYICRGKKKIVGVQDSKEWVEGYYIGSFQGVPYVIQELDVIYDEENPLMDAITPCEPGSIGQATGVTDASKDKRTIFDGDIIESEKGIRHLVRYDESEAKFEAVPLPLSPWGSGGSLKQSWVDEYHKKVVGNKIDNPELILSEY